MNLKTVIFGLIAVVGLFSLAFCQNKIDVPKVVTDAFSAKYPTAKKVEWEMEDATEYEAEFKLGGAEMSANFKTDGTWLETEMEINKEDLPEVVKTAIATQFSDYELEDAEQVEKPGAAMAYEVQLENEATDTEIEAVFGADGTLIKQEVKTEEEDEDNK